MKRKVIAVDLDKTLAEHHGACGNLTQIGAPIPAMVEKVKSWLAEGSRVVVFTARMSHTTQSARVEKAIGDWTEKHVGKRLKATCIKSSEFSEFHDDRAVPVIPNGGPAAVTVVPETLMTPRRMNGKPGGHAGYGR